MDYPKIITDKCTGCGLCVDDCNWGVLEMSGSLAKVNQRYACVQCGHCVAVCPVDAVDYVAIGKPEEKRQIQQPEDFYALLLSRRSIRKYKKKPVPEALVKKLLDAASLAPSGCNSKSAEVVVITNPDVLDWVEKRVGTALKRLARISTNSLVHLVLARFPLAGVRRLVEPNLFAGAKAISRSKAGDRPFVNFNAPVLMLFHADPAKSTPCEDCMLAAGNVVMMAQASGLGTCFNGNVAGIVNAFSKMRRKLNIPKGHKVYAAVSLGFPAIKHRYGTPTRQIRSVFIR